MTFSLPEPLAAELLKSVSPLNRSLYVAEALMAKLQMQDEELARACDLPNQNQDILLIEREFDAISSDHCCPVKSRTESTGCRDRVVPLGSPMLGGPVKWAFSQKALSLIHISEPTRLG